MERNVSWQVILNPHAGCGKGRRDKAKIVSILNHSGLRYCLHESEYAGHAFEQAKNLAINGETHFIVAGGASVGIGKFNGGGMMQVPDANPVNGYFHITIIRNLGIWGIVKNFMKLYNGSFVSDYRVSTHTGKQVQITAEKPISGEVDGESIGNSSFNLKIIPHQLRVIYGEDKFKMLE